jgi:hypothetical protein
MKNSQFDSQQESTLDAGLWIEYLKFNACQIELGVDASRKLIA